MPNTPVGRISGRRRPASPTSTAASTAKRRRERHRSKCHIASGGRDCRRSRRHYDEWRLTVQSLVRRRSLDTRLRGVRPRLNGFVHRLAPRAVTGATELRSNDQKYQEVIHPCCLLLTKITTSRQTRHFGPGVCPSRLPLPWRRRITRRSPRRRRRCWFGATPSRADPERQDARSTSACSITMPTLISTLQSPVRAADESSQPPGITAVHRSFEGHRSRRESQMTAFIPRDQRRRVRAPGRSGFPMRPRWWSNPKIAFAPYRSAATSVSESM